MTNHDMSLKNKAQSTIDEIRLILIYNDCQKIFLRLNNMLMVFIILHALCEDFESIRIQALTSLNFPNCKGVNQSSYSKFESLHKVLD